MAIGGYMDDGVLAHLRRVASEPMKAGEIEVTEHEDHGLTLTPVVYGTVRYDASIYMDEQQVWEFRQRLRETGPALPPGSGLIFQLTLYFAFIVGIFVGYMIFG